MGDWITPTGSVRTAPHVKAVVVVVEVVVELVVVLVEVVVVMLDKIVDVMLDVMLAMVDSVRVIAVKIPQIQGNLSNIHF